MQAPFPIAVLRGRDHEIELANPPMLAAWGKDASVVGKPLIEAIPELRGQPFLGYLDEVLRSGVAYKAQGALVRLVRSADGKPQDFYFDFVYAPLRDEQGTVDGLLVAAFEVTAQVQTAQDLARTRPDHVAHHLTNDPQRFASVRPAQTSRGSRCCRDRRQPRTVAH